ncbi:MAG: LacI family DNA-binding transcriptional regulator [Bifidobacteriaceae bacterium]|nr:LacI family DNA-binding transcriptional regulator [Bifidobacteriaceae bacterium]
MAVVTIEDVASEAGVSPTTVSHVFSGHRPGRSLSCQTLPESPLLLCRSSSCVPHGELVTVNINPTITRRDTHVSADTPPARTRQRDHGDRRHRFDVVVVHRRIRSCMVTVRWKTPACLPGARP